jgi:hypothetical protein
MLLEPKLGLEWAVSWELDSLLHHNVQRLLDILPHSKQRSIHTSPTANNMGHNRGTCSH